MGFQHVYVTAHGEFNGVPEWAGEKGQIGIRLVSAPGADEPTKGSTFTPIDNGDVVLDSGTQAGTHGTLSRTWKGRIGPAGSPDNYDATSQVDLAEDFWTFLDATKGVVSTGWRWTHVKIAPIMADGTYGAPSALYQFTTPLQGTGTGSLMPPECAIAVSFRAPVIGRRGRGRFYIPAPSATAALGSNGVVASSARTTLSNAAATLVGNLQDLPGVEEYGPIVAVLSAGSSVAVRPTQVRVGDHFDAQRRRQHQTIETYTSVAL